MTMGVRALIAALTACAAGVPAAPAAAAGLAGDFNGDGRSDLAIGAPLENIPEAAGADEGVVMVLPGDIAGLDPTDPAHLALTQQTAGLAGDGAENGDRFGSALASGDFNGDGRADLVVGVSSEDVRGAEGTGDNAGAFHVIYGSAGGLTPTRDNFITGDEAGLAGDGAEAGDQFASSMAGGDFNGDGRDDLAVGAIDEEVSDDEFAGAVTILYGSPAGLVTARSRFITQDTRGIAGDGAESPDDFGFALAAGDFNRDGRDDLAAGSPGEALGSSGQRHGAVHLLYGSRKGITTKGDRLLTQDTPGIPTPAESLDQFGIALAAGDFDADKADDLAVGTREDGNPMSGFDRVGAVHVLYGATKGPTTKGNELLSKELDGFPIQGGVNGDNFGAALAAGRFDAGKTDDLAIGIPGQEVGSPIRRAASGGPPVTDAGAVAVMHSTNAGLLGRGPGGTVTFDADLLTQDTPDLEAGAGAGANEFFGQDALSVGDFDGAGREDLAIGVSRDTVAGQQAAGAFHVIYGFANGLSLNEDQYFDQADTGLGTVEALDFFGASLAP